jgi:hypothetical protein
MNEEGAFKLKIKKRCKSGKTDLRLLYPKAIGTRYD